MKLVMRSVLLALPLSVVLASCAAGPPVLSEEEKAARITINPFQDNTDAGPDFWPLLQLHFPPQYPSCSWLQSARIRPRCRQCRGSPRVPGSLALECGRRLRRDQTPGWRASRQGWSHLHDRLGAEGVRVRRQQWPQDLGRAAQVRQRALGRVLHRRRAGNHGRQADRRIRLRVCGRAEAFRRVRDLASHRGVALVELPGGHRQPGISDLHEQRFLFDRHRHRRDCLE